MSAFRLGEYVEVWSVSQKSWDVATVTEVHADGTILTQYQRSDSGLKTFPLSAQVPGFIRKAAMVDMHGNHHNTGSKFVQGQRVNCFSKSNNAWVMAKILNVHRDGRIDVQYDGTGAFKCLELSDQRHDTIRPALVVLLGNHHNTGSKAWPSSEKNAVLAAIKLQKVFRGRLVRRWVVRQFPQVVFQWRAQPVARPLFIAAY